MATVATVKVGVLNASYEPMTPTDISRAVSLLERGSAVIEEEDPDRRLNHKYGSFPWPLTIRLLQYRKVPIRYSPQPWSKTGVLKRDSHECAYCTKRKATTIDHIVPQDQGGPNTWENTIAACQPCNGKKRNRTPEEAHMPLRFHPTVPMRYHISSK